MSAKVPGAHSRHVDAPALDVRPTGHAVQLAAAVVAEKLPAGHAVQLDAPAAANDPGWHAVQFEPA